MSVKTHTMSYSSWSGIKYIIFRHEPTSTYERSNRQRRRHFLGITLFLHVLLAGAAAAAVRQKLIGWKERAGLRSWTNILQKHAVNKLPVIQKRPVTRTLTKCFIDQSAILVAHPHQHSGLEYNKCADHPSGSKATVKKTCFRYLSLLTCWYARLLMIIFFAQTIVATAVAVGIHVYW